MLRPTKTSKTNNGNQIEYYKQANSSSVLIIGVFHGDEPQGDYLIRKYFSCINNQSNLSFIPCLNPDGMGFDKRTNSNGVDLNRNFPTKNWELSPKDNYYGGEKPACEIETRFLIDIINESKPKLILTLHAPYKVVNYDGDAIEMAKKISDIMKYPVQSDIGYPTPGSFGTWAGIENGIPTITLELDEERPVESYENDVFKVFKMLEHNI